MKSKKKEGPEQKTFKKPIKAPIPTKKKDDKNDIKEFNDLEKEDSTIKKNILKKKYKKNIDNEKKELKIENNKENNIQNEQIEEKIK